MPGSGFGFPNYPQRPTVSPNDVGSLLAQRAQAGQPAPGNVNPSAIKGAGPGGAMMDPTATLTGVPPRLLTAYQDATRSGGDEALGSSLSIAMREAERRGPPGPAQQRTAAAPFSHEQMLRMGLSPAEIRILQLSGGTK